MIELRKHVERIVRPICGSNRRKDRIRAELLAHLATIYDEELVTYTDDPAGALAAAFERFGNPTELWAELQASVPRFEQLMCTSFPRDKGAFARRPGETSGAHLRRGCLRSMAINAAIWSALLLFLWVMRARRPERPHEASLAWLTVFAVAYVVCLFPIAVFGPMLLGENIWRARQSLVGAGAALRRRMILSIVGYVLTMTAIYAAIAAAILLLIAETVAIPLVSDFWFWAIIFLASLLGPPAALLQLPDLRRWYEWEDLELDEPRTTV